MDVVKSGYWLVVTFHYGQYRSCPCYPWGLPDDLLAAAGGAAGEYVLAGMDPVGGRPLLGSVADDPVEN